MPRRIEVTQSLILDAEYLANRNLHTRLDLHLLLRYCLPYDLLPDGLSPYNIYLPLYIKHVEASSVDLYFLKDHKLLSIDNILGYAKNVSIEYDKNYLIKPFSFKYCGVPGRICAKNS